MSVGTTSLRLKQGAGASATTETPWIAADRAARDALEEMLALQRQTLYALVLICSEITGVDLDVDGLIEPQGEIE